MKTRNKTRGNGVEQVTKEFVTIGDAAEILHVSIDTIRRWEKAGTLKAIRLDGKNRYFDVEELEHFASTQPLSSSEVAALLSVSPSTVRRLEQQGKLTSSRNSNGKRLYDRGHIDAYLNQQKSADLTQEDEIQIPSLQPSAELEPEPSAAETAPAPSLAQPPKLSRQPHQSHVRLPAFNFANHEWHKLRRWEVLHRLLIRKEVAHVMAGLAAAVAVCVFLFFLAPTRMSHWFGYTSANNDDKHFNAQAQNISWPARLLKPFGNAGLGVVGIFNPDLEEKIRPHSPIKNINQIFTTNKEGDITAKYVLSVPDTSYIKIPDQGLISNLNSEFVQGKKPGSEAGNLSILPLDGKDIKGGTITSAQIQDGTIQLSDLSAATISALRSSGSGGTYNSGPQGPQGAVGPQGPSGPQGPQGPAGQDGTGTINDVIAGLGLSGGGSNGAVTLDVSVGNSTEIVNDSVEVRIAASATTGTTSTPSGLEVSPQGLRLIGGCSTGQILKWNGSAWACAADSGGGGGSVDVQSSDGSVVVSGASNIQFGPTSSSSDEFNLTNLGSSQVRVRLGTNVLQTTNFASTLDPVYVNVSEAPAAGDITGSFSSGLNVGANAVALGTDTTGNYLATLTGATGLTVTGSGVESGAANIALDVITTGTTGTSSGNSGLEVGADGLRLLGGCSNNQILKWNSGTSVWACAADNSSSLDVQEGGSTVTTSATAINFVANDFNVSNSVSQANVSIDYTNSGITQKNVASTITGTWGLQDSSVSFQDNADSTKKLLFELSGISTGTTRTLTVPDGSGTLITTANLSSITSVGTDAVVLGTNTTGNYVASLGGLTGLSTTGNSGEGSNPTLAVLYGSAANTAAQGNTTFTCAGGTGNLTGGGTTITVGSGGSCAAINTVNNPSFTTSVTSPLLTNAGALTLSTTGATNDLTLSSGRNIILSGFNCSGNTNGGKLTTDASGVLKCDNDTGGAAGSISGSGTTNRLPVFNSSNNITDSWLLQNTSTLQLDSGKNLQLVAGDLTLTSGNASITGNLTASGTITLSGLNSAGVVHTNGSGVLSTGTVSLGSETTGSYVNSLGSLTGLSTTGNSGAGSTPTLSVLYGSSANNAAAGSNTFTCASGTGNLTGGGTTVTIGTSGTTCAAINTVNNPSFSGLVTASASTTGLSLTGAPNNAGNTSLIQIGSAIASGNTATNGGTYIGLNAPNSGAGSAADFINLQLNGSSKFLVTNAGNVTATSFIGALTGNASTASALAANPVDCSANQFATAIAANGDLSCASLTDADVPNNITVDLATTATALAANPSDCSANQFATTIAASGNLTCAAIAANNLPSVAADLGAANVTIDLSNTNGSFVTNLTTDGTITAATFSGALSGNATTATALAANPADCSANQFATTIAANGDLTCSTVSKSALANSGTLGFTWSDSEVSDTLTASIFVGSGSTTNAVDLGTAEVAGTLGVANGGTGITSYTTGDLIYASGATTLSKLTDVATGSCLVSGGVGVAPQWGSCASGGSITGSGTANTLPLFTSSGVLGDSWLSQSGTTLQLASGKDLSLASGNVTATTFNGALSGNATTATALAANPSDCSANQFATAIAANGNLTCASLTDGDVPDNITLNTATVITGTAGLSLNKTLAANSGSTQNVAAITFSTPTDSSGTNVAQAINITPTIGNATGGANTANIINVDALTGDAQVTVNALKIGDLTGTAAAETVFNIGSGWDNVLSVGGSAIINGSGVIQGAGISGNYSGITGVGTITSGTWNGTALTDAFVSDSITVGAGGSVNDAALSANVTKLGSAIDLGGSEVAGNLLATNLQNTATDLGNADVTVDLTNSHAGKVTNLTTDGTITAATFSGALSGNATTATALAANPADCSANQFATTIAANGDLACASLTDADIPNNITIDNATTAANLVGSGSTTNAVDLGTAEVAGVLGAGNGGTGISSYTAGDLIYATGAATLSKLAKGLDGQCLQVVSGAPAWGGCASGSLFSIAASSGSNQSVNGGNTVSFLAGASGNLTTTAASGPQITFDIVNNPTFTTSVTTPLLTSSANLAIRAGGTGTLTLNTTDSTTVSTAGITIKSGDASSGSNLSAGSVRIDTGTTTGAGTGIVNVADTNATSLNLGRTGITTTNNGALTVSQGLTANGGVSVAANQNLSLQSGTGTIAQTYANSSGTAATFAVTDNASSGTTTVNGVAINLTGTANNTGVNTLSALSFANPAAATNNNYYALNFTGTGYTDILRVGSTQIINGSGVLQSSGLSGTYSNALTLSNAGNAFTGSLSGNATTATALAANPADCSANQFATTIAANGDLSCSTVSKSALANSGTLGFTWSDSEVSDTLTIGASSTVADGALSANVTKLGSAIDLATSEVSGNLLATNLQNAAADLGNADVTIDFTNSHAGRVTNLTLDGTITAATFSGALSGNATTATALAANPSDCSANQFATTIAASGNLTCAAIAANNLPSAAADLGAADVTINLGNTNGSFNTNLTTDGTVTATTFIGALTGNASTATALAANPSDCSANQFATTIAASGNLTCASIAANNLPSAGADLGAADVTVDLSNSHSGFNTNLTVDGTITAATFSGALSGNATTATALAANPSDCSANQFATTIAASGNLTCAAIAANNLPSAAADLGAANVTIDLSNTNGSFVTNLTTDGTITAATFSGALSGNATTATALAANPADCSANQFATTIAANGDLTCAAIKASNLPSAAADLGAADVTINLGNTNGSFNTNITTDGTITASSFSGALTGNASTATALAANPTDCSANQFATTIDAGGNLTCASIKANNLPSAGADLGAANVTIDLSNTNGSFVTNLTVDGTITATTFSGALSGNATTATALAANPSDCSANQFATTIAASGNLTCAAIAANNLPSAAADLGAADVTINLGNTNGSFNTNLTLDGTITATTFSGALTGNASTATALAANPADCSANQFATTIAANGDLTCAALSDSSVPDNITLNTSTIITGTAGLSLNKTLSVNSGSTQNVQAITFASPADTSGTNTSQGLNITPTIGNATAGTNTANIVNIDAVTGDAQVSLNAINIGALTGTAANEYVFNIGSGWDSILRVGGTEIINGSGVLQSSGLSGAYSNALTLSNAGNAFTGSLSGNATTATALAANPSDCSANQFATTIAASGNLTCAAIAANNLPSVAADLGAANVTIDLSNTNGSFVTNLTTDGTITAATFSGALSGNATTATALAANPADCSANQFATTIAANGDLTCAALSDSSVPDNITLNTSTIITGTGGSSINKTLSVNSGATQNVELITFSSPADSSGTNTAQGLSITPTIGNATAGTNTANIFNIDAVTGDAQVTLNAINIGALTGTAATENALNIGSGWDSILATTSTAPKITIANTGSLTISDGTNTIFTLADAGTTGTLTTGTVNATTAYQANGTAGVNIGACTASQYFGAARSIEGIITAGVCTNDATGISDIRLKKDVNSLGSVLDEIKNINTYSFYYKCDDPQYVDLRLDCTKQEGVIAQELMTVFPDLVDQRSDGYYEVNYRALSVYTLDAVTELAKMIGSNGDANLHDIKATTVDVSSIITESVSTPYRVAETVNTGDVVTVDDQGLLHKSITSFQKGLVGVVTDASGLADNGSVPVASSGRTTVNVIGPVTAGDPLTSSSVAGVATKASGSGPIIGVAVTSFSGSGQGQIQVMVNAGFFGGDNSSLTQLQNQVNSLESRVDDIDLAHLQVGTITAQQDAIINGSLSVSGQATFNGDSLFASLVTFIKPVSFDDDVIFGGNVSFNSNTGGYAVISSGKQSVHISFGKPYAQPPVISLTLGSNSLAHYSYQNVTTTGFDIVLDQPALETVQFSWIALSVNGANTFVQQ